MKKEKLPSGSYRVRKMVNGKRVSFTFDHKPTNEEVETEVAKVKGNPLSLQTITFEEASKQYVDLKRNVLSEASIREYSRMCGRLPKWFQEIKICDIDQVVVQKLVNEMSKTLSAKTVCDRHAFVCAVLRLFNPSMVLYTTLPKKVRKEPYIPTHEEVKKIIDNSVGTQYHIALQLACYGLRREEICAVELPDLTEENGTYYLSINKALVQNENKEWVIDKTKTVYSVRTIVIDNELAEEILSEVKEGRIFKGYPETIGTHLKRTQDKLGIEHFSMHKLRHYFCTTLAENNIDEATILALGGWKKGSTVMKEIYRHTNIQREKEKMIEAGNILKTSRS